MSRIDESGFAPRTARNPTQGDPYQMQGALGAGAYHLIADLGGDQHCNGGSLARL